MVNYNRFKQLKIKPERVKIFLQWINAQKIKIDELKG